MLDRSQTLNVRGKEKKRKVVASIILRQMCTNILSMFMSRDESFSITWELPQSQCHHIDLVLINHYRC